MKLKKIFAVLSATALAASCMAISASAATRLPDVCHPDEENTDMNDAYYSICAIGFYMNNGWTGWNQFDDIGNIDEDGILEASFDISEGLTFGGEQESGNQDNTLGMMGFMICNLPEEYPYEINILEADFTPKDGSTIDLASVKNMTELDVFPEKKDADVKDARIVIRATPDDANNVAATPEVEGMDQSGNFKGGKLHIKIDFGKYEPESEDSTEANDSTTDESKSDESKSDKDSKTDDSNASGTDSNASSKSDSSSSKGGNGNGGGNGGNGGSKGGATAAATSAEDGEAKSDATESSDTGAAQGVALAVIALAGAGIVVAKMKH